MLFGHAFKQSENPDAPVNRIILIITGLIPIALVWIFGGSPIELIISAQAINGLLLPVLTVVLYRLTNKKRSYGSVSKLRIKQHHYAFHNWPRNITRHSCIYKFLLNKSLS